MDFKYKPSKWKNEGKEPTQELKEKGFTAGYKPPASYFNWFWSLTGNCITELQEKLKTRLGIEDLANNLTTTETGLALDAVQGALLEKKKADKTTQHPITLLASNWIGESTPYSYILELPEITEENTITLIPSEEITVEQYTALLSAQIEDATQTAGSITLQAKGSKPTMDIPILVLIGDSNVQISGGGATIPLINHLLTENAGVGALDALQGAVIGQELEDVKKHIIAGYDGVNLNMTFEQLKAKVATGDFSGLHLYDYIDFTMSTGEQVRAEIMGFNTMMHFGDQMLTKPHVLMQFRDCLANTYQYNSVSTNAGGYNGSTLLNSMNTVLTQLPMDLQNAILECRRLESVKGDWVWYGRKIFLPTEVEVFGNASWSEPVYGTGSSKQWEGFANSYKHIVKRPGKGEVSQSLRYNWWLSVPEASNTTSFCLVSHTGIAYSNYASNDHGVAPAFLIG